MMKVQISDCFFVLDIFISPLVFFSLSIASSTRLLLCSVTSIVVFLLLFVNLMGICLGS